MTILQTFRASWLPELASLGGVALTIYGVWLALKAARDAASLASEARDAANIASLAAQAARDELIRVQVFIDLSAAITAMESIKILHREKAWGRLVDKYSDARRLLIQVRASSYDLTEEQKTLITNCNANFTALERNIDRNIDNLDRFNISKANQNVSENIDQLVEMLYTLRSLGHENVSREISSVNSIAR